MKDRVLVILDSWWESEDGVEVYVEKTYDPDTRTIHTNRYPTRPFESPTEGLRFNLDTSPSL